MTHRITKVAGDEPQLAVTLEQAKQHLSITTDALDELIMLNLQIAHDWAEDFTHRAIAQRSYLIVADVFPVAAWRLPLGYISSITQIQYLDTDGNLQVWDSANYSLDNLSNSAARLRPIPTQTWPDVGEYDSAARLTVVAGWTAVDVPYPIRAGILQKLAVLFEARAPGDPEADAIERAARNLLRPYELPVWA